MASMKINANEEKIKAQNERKTATVALRRTKWITNSNELQRRWTYNCRLSHVWRTTRTYILISKAHLIRCECKIGITFGFTHEFIVKTQGINWKRLWRWSKSRSGNENTLIDTYHLWSQTHRESEREREKITLHSSQLETGIYVKRALKFNLNWSNIPANHIETDNQPNQPHSTDRMNFYFAVSFPFHQSLIYWISKYKKKRR